MIVLNLICSSQHRFEGWFNSNDAFEQQHAAKGVSCPFCGSDEVVRLPAAPRIKRQLPSLPAPITDTSPIKDSHTSPEAALMAAFRHLVAQCEDVGDRFPEEARKIHYDEVPQRKIKGRSTTAEALELLEEGIPILPLPPSSNDEMH